MRGRLITSLLLGLSVAGCGGAAKRSPAPSQPKPSTVTTVAARSDATCVPLSRKHLFVIAPGSALVEMKQEPPSLLWQTVFVRSDGTGLVTTLDGEITGAHEAPFKLTPARFALLRRLIADTRPPHRKLPIGTHSGYVYLIHTRGQPDVATDARTPTRYGRLARFLDQLMFTYSC